VSEVVELVDDERGRRLETHLYRAGADDAPLVVFAHGWLGHPRKFTRLLGRLRDAGLTVAAPAFPRTNDLAAEPSFDDVVEQPRDLAFVADALGAGRALYAGFSLGAITVLAAAFAAADPRPAAVVAISGRLDDRFSYSFRPLPLLVVHATGDPVVPYADGLRAFDAAPGPKDLLALGTGTHHEGIEDEPAPCVSALVDAATTAFLLTRAPG
jgi:pimeloyl-ACP methyl ester carboxylesterase